MKTILTTLIIILSLSINAQELLPKSITIPNCDNKYHLSEAPITNREYLSYLLWLDRVYNDHPELNRAVIESIPGIDVENLDEFLLVCNDSLTKTLKKHHSWGEHYISDEKLLTKKIIVLKYELIVNNTKPFVEQYMFNPKYLDYPVIGLSQVQALNFLKWLSDRYNEFQLIQHDILKFDKYSIYENSFETEAYIAEQYNGIVKTENRRKINWNDGLFVPAFRLPCQSELNKTNTTTIVYKKYKSNKLKFLNPWLIEVKQIHNEYLVELSDYYDSDEIKVPFIHISAQNTNDEYHYLPTNELTLNNKDNINEENYLKVLSDLGYPAISKSKYLDFEGFEIEKSSYGNMGYLTIDVNDEGNFVYIDNYRTQIFYNAHMKTRTSDELYTLPINYQYEQELRPFRFVFTTPFNNLK